MDDKKKNLTPELKQIYERVMNTPAGARTNPNAQTQPQAQTPVTASPAPIQASQTAQTPPISQSTQPQMPPIPAPTGPSVTPSQTTLPPQPAQGVSFAAPQPVNPSGSFVFTGKNNNTASPAPTPIAGQTMATKSGKKLSSPIIAILVGVLMIAWGIFWAKIFGFF